MIKSRKRMKKIFKKLDADQDSILSKAEFMVLIHTLLEGQKEILKTSEALLDLVWMSVLGAKASTELKEDNADNAIDLETFACWLGFDKSSKKKTKTKTEEEIEKHKDKNTNKNTMSFDAEFEADQIRLKLASASKDKFNKIFKAVDKDTSGKMSTSEFEI